MTQTAVPTLTLAQLADYQPCTVDRIAAPSDAPEWHDWLEEIGFLPGERAMVMNRALPGGDPLVVRVGNSTFALRRVEAACVHVSLDPATA
ncbi:MAG: FeoA family protein [Thiobacillus sp.]|nr:FeoA family protein [Thiobacillus sp.]